MRCPYACKTKTEYETWDQTYDDEKPVKCETVRQYVFEWEECRKEDCGAWYDGRCHYKDE